MYTRLHFSWCALCPFSQRPRFQPRRSKAPRWLAPSGLPSSCQAAWRGQGRSPDLAKATESSSQRSDSTGAGASWAFGPARVSVAAGPALQERSGHTAALPAPSPAPLISFHRGQRCGGAARSHHNERVGNTAGAKTPSQPFCRHHCWL